MAAVEVTISGMLYDKLNRTTQNVVLIGEATLTGLGVGGGPIFPPPSGGGGNPPGIWGPTDPRPNPPIANVPPGSNPNPPGFGLRPEHPIVLPPEQVPPDMKPPEAPAPGSPTTSVPGNWPVQPVTPPEYLVVNYPGIGPVVVAPPVQTSPNS